MGKYTATLVTGTRVLVDGGDTIMDDEVCSAGAAILGVG